MSGPNVLEMEREILGCVLLDSDLYGVIAEQVRADDFGHPHHRATWKLIGELVGETDEPVTLSEVLLHADARGISEYGGHEYLAGLSGHGIIGHHPTAIRYVRRASMARDLRILAARLAEAVEDDSRDPTEVLARHEALLATVRRPDEGRAGWVRFADTVPEVMADLADRETHGGMGTGLSTGFRDLDDKLAGLQPKDLIVLGARPSMGKSALALSVAMHAARRDVAVGIFSLEMSRAALVVRALCAEAAVDMGRFRSASLAAHEQARLSAGARQVAGLPIYVDEKVGTSIAELRLRGRQLRQQVPNLGLLVVDYLQLVHGSRGKGQSREQEIAEVSMGLKQMAREIGCPVLALAQLNRAVESRPVNSRRPEMSDLRDSGQIEQDADVVLFLYRHVVYDPTTVDKDVAEVIVAKQRNGTLGTVKLRWQGAVQRFTALDERHEEPPARRPWYAEEES